MVQELVLLMLKELEINLRELHLVVLKLEEAHNITVHPLLIDTLQLLVDKPHHIIKNNKRLFGVFF